MASDSGYTFPAMSEPGWSFLTNHGLVLLCVAGNPDIRLRDIATTVGITERAAHRIVGELVDSGYVEREREGRRNRYQVHMDRPLHVPVARDVQLDDMLRVMSPQAA